MAKYKLISAAVIDDVRREVGYEFEYEGVPGSHMEPVDAAAKKAVEDRDKANPGTQVGSPVGGYIHVDPPPLTPPVPPAPPEAAAKEESKKEEPKEEVHRTVPRDHEGGGRRG